MLNKDLEISLNMAFRQAKDSRHEFMTVEHLLLALLDNPSSIEALKACGADMGKIRKELLDFIAETTPVIPEGEIERETQPTLGFQRVLQRAVFHVQSSGKSDEKPPPSFEIFRLTLAQQRVRTPSALFWAEQVLRAWHIRSNVFQTLQ